MASRRSMRKLPICRDGAAQEVDFDGSVQSAAIGSGTTVVRLCSTQDCRYLVGSNPTAVATSPFLPANIFLHLEVTGGDKIAAIKQTAAGKLIIVECI